MKRNLFIAFLCGMALTSLFAFKTMYEAKKGTAEVSQEQGLYIFIQSKPVSEFDYLGSVKKSVSWSGAPEEMLNSIIKKVKKEYPNAEAIVFTSLDMDKADAVKFK